MPLMPMPNWEWKGDHGEQLRDLSWLALPASPLPQAVTQRAARPPTLVRAVAEQGKSWFRRNLCTASSKPGLLALPLPYSIHLSLT